MKSLRQHALLAILLLRLLPAFADDVITNIMSPIVSYQYSEDFSSGALTNGGIESTVVSYEFFQDLGNEVLTNGGVQSSILSYNYLENFDSEILTNGGIMSPIASYQYYEWPGNDILSLQYSPNVSYYYQYVTANGDIILHGHVSDVNGVSIAGATVSAAVYMNSLAEGTADANGNYELPPISAGVYDLSAWDATHQTSVRVLTLNTNTAQEDFQLKPFPTVPNTQPVNRQSTVSYSVDTKGSRLLFFNGTSFVSIDANNAPSPNLMTIVLTHGWVPETPDSNIMTTPFDEWPTNMAPLLWEAGITTNVANIVAWDWRYAAMDPLDLTKLELAPSDAVDATPDQGVALGEALTNYLGQNYSQPIHFIGHSLGTIVNAAAANFLYGDPNGNARRPVSTSPWSSPMHMTLLDEAQIAETFGSQALQDGPEISAIDAYMGIYGDSNQALNWQSPLPNSYVWADNYESLVGFKFSGSANVWLQKAPYIVTSETTDPFEGIHGYPINWYGMSITNPLDIKNPMGFQNSFEFTALNRLPFVTSDIFKIDSNTVFQQVPADSDPLSLEPVSAATQTIGRIPDTVLTGIDNLWQNTVQTVGQVSLGVVNTTQQTAQAVEQDYDYASGMAAQGGQAVVNLFDSTVLQITLTTLLAKAPGYNLANSSNTPRPSDLNENDGTNTPAMVWLPVQIPTNALVMAFDFRVSGDPVDDTLVCGIETNNLFSLQAKYIPTNLFSSSRLITVSPWAGTTNELFFGFLGGTSTNASLIIENIRFYDNIQPPNLSVQMTNNIVAVSWPLSVNGYILEVSSDITDINSWQTDTNEPQISSNSYLITEPVTSGNRFYRLRQQ